MPGDEVIMSFRRARLVRDAVAILACANGGQASRPDEIATRQRAADEKREQISERDDSAADFPSTSIQ